MAKAQLDHSLQFAVMHSSERFAHVAAGNTFNYGQIHAAVVEALGCASEH